MNKNDILFTIIGIVALGFVCLAIANGIYGYFNTTTITEQGTITSVIPNLNNNQNIECCTVTFDNGHSYDIYVHNYHEQTTDFTVHSKIILEIHKSKYFFNFDVPGLIDGKYWVINTFIKIPS